MKIHKKNKMAGITLIALVVTIIVLLILAGISMAMLNGENGILGKVGEAKVESEKAQKKEDIRLANLELQNKQTNNITPDQATKHIKKSLEDKYGQDNIEVWSVNSNSGPIIRIDFNKKESFILDDDKIEENTEYKNEAGTVYRKFEVYDKTGSPGTKYRDCEEMIALLMPNYAMKYPNAVTTNMFTGSTNLKSIKIPVAINGGHYVFSELPNLEYLELGSIGYPWGGAGYYRTGTLPGGYSSHNIGTPAGLTLEAYMNSYSSSAGFQGAYAIVPSPNTTMIIRLAETGEILKPE